MKRPFNSQLRKNRGFTPPVESQLLSNLWGRNLSTNTLNTKLTTLWKLKENFTLVDMGLDFYMMKFQDESSQKKAIQEDP